MCFHVEPDHALYTSTLLMTMDSDTGDSNNNRFRFEKLAWLLVAVLIGVGIVCLKENQSPQQVGKRLRRILSRALQEDPTPTPAPAPTPAIAAEPASTPEPLPPAPEPTPEPPAPVDPLSWILDHKDLWPKQVTLLGPAEFPAVFKGKVVGSTKVPPGTVVKVHSIERDNVAVIFNGGGARIPIASTNLLALATEEMNKAGVTTQ